MTVKPLPCLTCSSKHQSPVPLWECCTKPSNSS